MYYMGSRSPMGRDNFEGETGEPLYGHSAVICANTSEPIEVPFGLWASLHGSIASSVRWGSRSPNGRGNSGG